MRMSAYECLTQCKIFDEYREPKKENALLKLRQQRALGIELAIDSWDAFNYETEIAKYNVNDLTQMLIEEIASI